MGYSVGNQKLCTTQEIKESVWSVEILALLMPCDSFLTSTTYKGVSNDPSFFHRRHFYDVEALTEFEPIGTITFHEHTIPPVWVNTPFLIVNIHRYLDTIMARHQKLFSFKVFPYYLRRSSELDILYFHEFSCLVIVFILLLIYERTTEHKPQSIFLIFLIQHR